MKLKYLLCVRLISERIELLKNLKSDKEEIKKMKEELECMKNERDENQFELEDAQDKIGLDTREKGSRAVLIICENKNDVKDIVKVLLVHHQHIYDYNGKIDGLRQIKEAYNKKISTKIKQVRPGDVIVATNVAGRGTDFKISKVCVNFLNFKNKLIS